MKVHLTSCETTADAWRHQEEQLRKLYRISSGQHELTEQPQEADLIIVGNLRDERWAESLRRHPLVGQFPDRCFAVSEAFELRPLLRGIYTSTSKRLGATGRFRSTGYTLYHPDFKNPLVEGYVGGAWDRPKTFLYSFTGRNCHPVRDAIFKSTPASPQFCVRDTSGFNLFTHDPAGKVEAQHTFVSVLESSKFALCPRGVGAASIRLFEAMKIGVAPIIVSDDWLLPHGPRWEDFAIVVPEAEVARIPEIAARAEPRYRELGQAAARAYREFFDDSAYFDYIVGQCASIRETQRIPERFYWYLRNLTVAKWKLGRRLKHWFRSTKTAS